MRADVRHLTSCLRSLLMLQTRTVSPVLHEKLSSFLAEVQQAASRSSKRLAMVVLCRKIGAHGSKMPRMEESVPFQKIVQTWIFGYL